MTQGERRCCRLLIRNASSVAMDIHVDTSDVPWLRSAPFEHTLAPGLPRAVHLQTHCREPGEYAGQLKIYTTLKQVRAWGQKMALDRDLGALSALDKDLGAMLALDRDLGAMLALDRGQQMQVEGVRLESCTRGSCPHLWMNPYLHHIVAAHPCGLHRTWLQHQASPMQTKPCLVQLSLWPQGMVEPLRHLSSVQVSHHSGKAGRHRELPYLCTCLQRFTLLRATHHDIHALHACLC